LVYWILRVKRQRDLLRQFIAELKGEERRVHVASPEEFLRRFAETLAIPYERDGSHVSTPGRITVRPMLDLFVSRGLVLIRCKDTEIQFHVKRVADGERDAMAVELSGALGSHVRVTVIGASN
jgi:hypothetical protein